MEMVEKNSEKNIDNEKNTEKIETVEKNIQVVKKWKKLDYEKGYRDREKYIHR